MTFEMMLLENRMAGYDKGHAEGCAEGLEKGLTEGRAVGLAEGLEKGLADGLEKGLEKGRGGIALKMLRKGNPLDEISELTELPIERIKQIAAENSIAIKL